MLKDIVEGRGVLTIECYHLAIRKVALDSLCDIGEEYDGEELNALISLVKEKNIEISSDELVEVIKKKQEASVDSDVKSLRMWMSLGTKTASDLFKKVLEYSEENISVNANKVSESEKDEREEAKKRAESEENKMSEEDKVDAFENDGIEKKGELYAETDKKRKGVRSIFTFLGIHKKEPTVAIIDYGHKITEGKENLNSEDIYSEGRRAFTDTQNDCPDTKVYVLETRSIRFNNEEKMSLYAKGAEGFVDFKSNGIAEVIEDICGKVC